MKETVAKESREYSHQAMLFDENVCENERIVSSWEGGGAPIDSFKESLKIQIQDFPLEGAPTSDAGAFRRKHVRKRNNWIPFRAGPRWTQIFKTDQFPSVAVLQQT